MTKRGKHATKGVVVVVIWVALYWFVGVEIPPEVVLPAGDDAPPLSAERWRPLDGAIVDVVRVVDGDTVEVSDRGSRIKVRIIGIDTPETVHPTKPVEVGGVEASARARGLLAGQRVAVRYDPDPKRERFDVYGRLLAYLELPDGRDYGLVMIEEGHAVAYTKYPCSREAIYVAAERARRR